MNVLAAAVNRGLRKIESQLGSEISTMIWRGEEVACTPSGLRRGEEVVVGGKLVTISQTLLARLEAFPEGYVVPSAGKLITYGGIDYRIATVYKSAPGSHYEITLTDKDA